MEVRGHGSEYEDKLKERERTNPKYAFLHRDVCTHSPSRRKQTAEYALQHRRYRFYCSLVDRDEPVDPEFDDEV